MTSIAILAVEHVSGYPAMTWIRLRLRVACRALKDAVIGRIGMTCCTHPSGISVICREPRMVECRTCPRCRCVTRLAGRRIARGCVVGIGRTFELGCMAGIAATIDKLIVTVCVA
jgi:hypothetical protein